MEEKILDNSYQNKNLLFIRVTNIKEFEELLDDVKRKEKALHEAVLKLENFNLEISFEVNKWCSIFCNDFKR